MAIDFGSLSQKLGKGLQKVFGSANEREVTRMRPIVAKVNELEGWAKGLDQAAMQARVREWKAKVQDGRATLDDALPEMFAMTREAGVRTLEMRHFDVQIIGGAVLHLGKIAEMVTGEGKTLVATLPAALNALDGKGVYVVTVNDYLAQRDRDWMAPVYEYLGFTVGAIQSRMSPQERHPQYASDITYGTNNEFGFDYLRDNMKHRVEDQVQKNLHYAIIDEVDSILVDEARTPLIISGEPDDESDKYKMADRIARQLAEGPDFEVKLKEKSAVLLEEGIEKAEKMAGVDSFYSDAQHMDWPHFIENSLRAHHVYQRDKEYVVKDNEIIIVDEFTGRLMPGRRWSDGLHQAIEVKEGIEPRQELQTLATITFQNYFRLFDKIAGMTGTAMTEAAEFEKIYELSVVSIPTNKPLIREDLDDKIYLGDEDKHQAILEDVTEQHRIGRPVLIGTTSIEKSERLSKLLGKAGIEHEVLNAKHHEREAEIVALAGQPGRVTVATNMAGRGTDIKLGPGVKDKGGLHIVGTERHEARRIDNQLRGRCGRQGDPGSTRFYLSFDDDLMKIFARDWVKSVMEKLGLKPGEAIESGMVSRGLARAQRKVEQRNFEIRKNLLEYDEVMDKQRKFLYSQRNEVLRGFEVRDKVLGMFDDVLGEVLDQVAADPDVPVDVERLQEWLQRKFGSDRDFGDLAAIPREELYDTLRERIEEHYEAKGRTMEPEVFEEFHRRLLIEVFDEHWKKHLKAMDDLKAGINMRAYANVNPKNEYKKEGYVKFEELKGTIARAVTDLFFRLELRPAQMEFRDHYSSAGSGSHGLPPLPADPREAVAMIQAMAAAGQLPPEIMEALANGGEIVVQGPGAPPPEPARRAEPAREQAPEPVPASFEGTGRNDPCPCGSGKKFKKCHGA
ncbi:MAG: preprotein translocase subunit SecA [Planctomycetota bacterium]